MSRERHPGLCAIHDVGELPAGRPYLATDYIEGESLAARLRRGPLPLFGVRRQAAALQTLDAVTEAGRRCIVLRPQTVLNNTTAEAKPGGKPARLLVTLVLLGGGNLLGGGK